MSKEWAHHSFTSFSHAINHQESLVARDLSASRNKPERCLYSRRDPVKDAAACKKAQWVLSCHGIRYLTHIHIYMPTTDVSFFHLGLSPTLTTTVVG